MGSFGGGWHYWVMPPPVSRACTFLIPCMCVSLAPLLYLVIHVLFICTRFNKAFELELEPLMLANGGVGPSRCWSNEACLGSYAIYFLCESFFSTHCLYYIFNVTI